MGGGGDKKYERAQIQKDQDKTNQDYSNFQDTINKDRGQRTDQANSTWNSISKGYTDFAETGGIRPEDEARIRAIYGAGGSGGGGGGASFTPSNSAVGGVNFAGDAASGISIPRNSKLEGVGSLAPSNYKDINTQIKSEFGNVDTGNVKSNLEGVNIARGSAADNIRGLDSEWDGPSAIGGLKDLGTTGGITPEVRAGVQRQSLLDTERTGGFTDNDISRVRAKAARNAPGMFDAVKSDLDRTRAVSGGTTGLGSTNFKLMRQASQQQNQDKQDSEIGLASAIRSGKMDAAKTLSANEMGLLSQGNSAKISALGTAGQLEGQKVDQLLRQAESKDAAASNQARMEIEKATGIDAVKFNNISQQLQKAGGLDSAASTNVMMQLQKAAGMDANAKDALMAEISKATGMDSFTLGALQAEIQKASVSNQFNLGMGGLQLQKAGMTDDWNLNQQSLAQSAANSSAAAGRANADDQFRMEQYLLEARNSGRLSGLGGLGDLRTSVPSEKLAYDEMWANSIGARSGANQGNRGLSLQNNAMNPGMGKQVIGALGGIAAGAAAGYTSGGTSFGRRPPTTGNAVGGGG